VPRALPLGAEWRYRRGEGHIAAKEDREAVALQQGHKESVLGLPLYDMPEAMQTAGFRCISRVSPFQERRGTA